ncbi:MAG: hypothetical protein EOP84_18325 [Verrucomicrobiaceae bacterium]|nr:MAG: hypothetical protein EOP84_18325 [Verrucomicrobiaceae bacterium]
MKSPSLLWLLFLFIPLSAFGQKGLLLYKDAPWDADQFVQVAPYKEIQKFPTVHNLVLLNDEKLRVKSALVIKDIRLPAQAGLPDITNQSQINVMNASVADWTATVSRYPGAAKHLKPRIAQLQSEIAQFRAGKVKVDGVWTTKEALLAKRKKDEEARRKLLAKLDEESKEMGMLAEEWANLDEASRKRLREAKLLAEEKQLKVDEEIRVQKEIERQRLLAEERAKMKPVQRLQTDVWVTPPGLDEGQTKEYKESLKVVREQLDKSHYDLGFGKEAQRMVLKTPDYVYAFKPAQLTPEIQVVHSEDKEKPSVLKLESAKKEEVFEIFPSDGSERAKVPLLVIPTAASMDVEKLVQNLSRVIELCGGERTDAKTAQH